MFRLDLHRKNQKIALGELKIDVELCCSCGACVAVCPPDALFLNAMYLTVDQQTCTSCSRCVAVCPVRALSLTDVESR